MHQCVKTNYSLPLSSSAVASTFFISLCMASNVSPPLSFLGVLPDVSFDVFNSLLLSSPFELLFELDSSIFFSTDSRRSKRVSGLGGFSEAFDPRWSIEVVGRTESCDDRLSIRVLGRRSDSTELVLDRLLLERPLSESLAESLRGEFSAKLTVFCFLSSSFFSFFFLSFFFADFSSFALDFLSFALLFSDKDRERKKVEWRTTQTQHAYRGLTHCSLGKCSVLKYDFRLYLMIKISFSHVPQAFNDS